MSHQLRKVHVVASRSQVVEGGAEHDEELLESIESMLERAALRDVRWLSRPVALGSPWFARPQPWLVIEHRAFPDIRQYIRSRPLGAHLELVHISAIEPPWWKRWGASLVSGGRWWSWSVPEDVGGEAELRSWLAVVARSVDAATKRLAERLGRAPVLGRLEWDVLGWW